MPAPFPTGFGAPAGGFPPGPTGGHLPVARHAGGDDPVPGRQHPSAPLPPMPAGAWNRLRPREDDMDDDATVAAPRLSGPRDDATEEPPAEPAADDPTGGLDVIGANVDDDRPRRRGLRRRRDDDAPGAVADDETVALHPQDDLDRHGDPDDGGLLHDDEIPVAPYDPRSDPQRRRRRRRPLAIGLALLILGGMVVGIVLAGQRLLGMLDPEARDYAGPGTGSVDVRVQQGDTLTDIARTLADADVIASTGPFVDAAQDEPAATGIQPGVYSLRLQMSGQGALELLLDPASRQVSRVTVPEGFTVDQVLARLAEQTGTPLAELEAAADPAALPLPPYAGGQLEGYLFPATYDFEPGTTPQQMLQRMVETFDEVAARLQLEERAAALGRTPGEVVTIASMIQSETRLDEERPDVAQVIYNRLDAGIALGIDATLAYGLDKSGNELTVTDLQSDDPYNTRNRRGLPPTPISSPGEASLEAALAPSTGDLLYYVLESQDGAHFFTSDYAEFQQARQRCADAGLGCGG
ncbi:endolytic transglycosylase MltG [Blastococcus sp. MG754426]|uniref:endolytic transglycosylase MltG n=1 Tax=unclassified Blastococcus TaxID=2619396 RepID=UPI001EF14D75|nr:MULTISPECIES: endolytic transglycosylase MltG [unclassified Blastococcus]MCF6508217.1 endolytic transglycosylase MltG [Blastococcus sp. MG754426]MCF6513817.1 endolytic transglycosylase MltG [Blastococcus sp. MG754427]